ncbi:MAG: hypothetical protein CBC94_000840 [Gammaproteobacteria bacterium TMED134]|nr:MAG: hypothetical protein CBC94_000840 [Gammaproteobacteria bacterium TMED134]
MNGGLQAQSRRRQRLLKDMGIDMWFQRKTLVEQNAMPEQAPRALSEPSFAGTKETPEPPAEVQSVQPAPNPVEPPAPYEPPPQGATSDDAPQEDNPVAPQEDNPVAPIALNFVAHDHFLFIDHQTIDEQALRFVSDLLVGLRWLTARDLHLDPPAARAFHWPMVASSRTPEVAIATFFEKYAPGAQQDIFLTEESLHILKPWLPQEDAPLVVLPSLSTLMMSAQQKRALWAKFANDSA